MSGGRRGSGGTAAGVARQARALGSAARNQQSASRARRKIRAAVEALIRYLLSRTQLMRTFQAGTPLLMCTSADRIFRARGQTHTRTHARTHLMPSLPQVRERLSKLLGRGRWGGGHSVRVGVVLVGNV